MIYRTKAGDVLDAICERHYAGSPYSLEVVLAANPGLAAHGPVMGAGILIDLPRRSDEAVEAPTIRLWD
ncbi:MAG: tail protein X [Pseudomonadota bacterium]